MPPKLDIINKYDHFFYICLKIKKLLIYIIQFFDQRISFHTPVCRKGAELHPWIIILPKRKYIVITWKWLYKEHIVMKTITIVISKKLL